MTRSLRTLFPSRPTLILALALTLIAGVGMLWIMSASPKTHQPVSFQPEASQTAALPAADTATPVVGAGSNLGAPAEPTPRGQTSDLNQLSQAEQQSLWKAFHEARREIRPLTAGQRAQARNEGVRFFAGNPSQQLTARFLDGAMRLESGAGENGWAGTLSLSSGAKVTPVAAGNRLEYHHSSTLTEWYVNGADGIEHGFTLQARPDDAGADHIRLNLNLDGLAARNVEDEEAIEFINPASGEAVARYDKLFVFDATGRELPASMVADGGEIAILVADNGATYPLTVDPLITSLEEKIVALGGLGYGNFGYSVALSGNTALIGATQLYDTFLGISSLPGSAYVFVYDGADWTLQAQLQPSDSATNDEFGISVALSGDTALVGADGGSGVGGAYVFVRSGTSWSQQTKLVSSTGDTSDLFGHAVALDENGDTAVVGAQRDDTTDTNAGCAFVFVRSSGVWSQQAILLAADGAAEDYFGRSVAASGDTVLIGSYLDDDNSTNSGSAYVFVRSAGLWSQQAKLLASNGSSYDWFGISVALSSDTALVGASRGQGAYVFVRSGSLWSQQAALTANDSTTDDFFGQSVALSGDTALIGAPGSASLNYSYSGNGNAYAFERSGSTWSQTFKLSASDGDDDDLFGHSVALSSTMALVGAIGDGDSGPESGSTYSFLRNGSSWDSEMKLRIPGGDPDDEFGFAVAISDTTAVIGSRYDDDLGSNSGSAYVMKFDNGAWTLHEKLLASDGFSFHRFGNAVSLDGNYALIGAYYDATTASQMGSAYVFKRSSPSSTTWSEQAKLTPADGAAFDRFGQSVALSGDSALIGSYWDDDNGNRSGSAYVFVRSGSTWSLQQKLAAGDGAADDYFGFSVDLVGDTALISAYLDDDGGASSGSVYVFDRSGSVWTETTKLNAGDPASGDNFGYSVALSADPFTTDPLAVSDMTALIGSPWDVDGGSQSGSAYVFQRDGASWTQQAKLVALDASAGDNFGTSVAIHGHVALIGAEGSTNSGSTTGSAYLFLRIGTSWGQDAELLAPDGTNDDYFGCSVALSESRALVGAYGDDHSQGINAGSAYCFSYNPQGIILNLGSLSDGVSSIEVGPIVSGTSGSSASISVGNSGGSELILVGIQIDGDDASAFSADTSSMLTTLQPGQSTSFTVILTDSSETTTTRNATLHLLSNALGADASFDIDISGDVLSPASDTDLDGLNDAAELQMAALGFDWGTAQTTLVDTLLNNAPTAGLYTSEQIQNLQIGTPLIERDDSGQFKLTIGISKSVNLSDPQNFVPLPMSDPETSINGEGKLEFQFTSPDDAAFFRVEAQ